MLFWLQKWVVVPLVLVIGWYLISKAADYYVLHYIRAVTGYYTSFSYAATAPFYCALSLPLIKFSIVLASQEGKVKWRWIYFWIGIFTVCIVFTMFEETRFGRPYAPEIAFLTVIMVFHMFLTWLSLKTGFLVKLQNQ